MTVVMLCNLVTYGGGEQRVRVYTQGMSYDLPRVRATDWIKRGWARVAQ